MTSNTNNSYGIIIIIRKSSQLFHKSTNITANHTFKENNTFQEFLPAMQYIMQTFHQFRHILQIQSEQKFTYEKSMVNKATYGIILPFLGAPHPVTAQQHVINMPWWPPSGTSIFSWKLEAKLGKVPATLPKKKQVWSRPIFQYGCFQQIGVPKMDGL